MVGEPQDVAGAITAIAAPAGGRLLVVSPRGLHGSPWEPDVLDGVELDGTTAVLSLGDGHAVYRLEGARLVEAHGERVLLAARALTTTVVPYGSSSRPVQTERFLDAELLVTTDRRDAEAARRTKGTPVEADA